MSNSRTILVNDEIYHINLRAVGDSLLFKDINDYYRGIFSIYEFNTVDLITIRERRRIRLEQKKNYSNYRSRTPVITDSVSDASYLLDKRDKLVEILAFCFMPNHFHMLVRQLKSNGISRFMQKIGTGYVNYFNRKYGRKGHLFNKFKAVHIKNDHQFKIVVPYIFTNPIALIEPKFKEKGIRNFKKVKEFLENYKWSSYLDCIGINNFPSVTNKEFLLEVMGGKIGCRESVENWIKHKEEMGKFSLILED